ncbi:MAG: VOC family protein [Pseudomonadota bacterium]
MTTEPWQLDHIVLGARDLASAETVLTAKLGAPPPAHGAHPTMGTHNALWALGGGSYLELVAIDPAAQAPDRPRWFGLDDPAQQARLSDGPVLLAWVVEPRDVDAARAALPEDPGPLERHYRDALHWHLTVPSDGLPRLGGALPHLIAWPDNITPPGRALPECGLRLDCLSVSLPDPTPLAALPLPETVQVEAGPPGLHARLTRADGRDLRLG